jgi:hypothetical protein
VLPELCRQINNNTNILKDQIITTVIKCSDNIQQQLQTELTASHQNIGCVVKRLQDAVSTCLQDAVKVRDRFACHCIILLHAINKKSNAILLPIYKTLLQVQIPQDLDFDVQNSSHGSDSKDQQETELQPVEEELPLFTAVISSAVTTMPEVLESEYSQCQRKVEHKVEERTTATKSILKKNYIVQPNQGICQEKENQS